jgi:TolB-like protein
VAAVAAGAFVFLRKPEVPAAPMIVPTPAPSSLLPAPSRQPAADSKSLAVLPFANLSTDKENEFFADGVHDDVITNLAKIRDLKVISRTSVLAYRDPAARNLKKIAVELGVGTILEGSIRRVGNKVHMNAQLIDARTDEHLWAETFDGNTDDIFALQAKLAQQIAGALKATLTGSERALIERRPTEDTVAYELFLRGRVLEQAFSSQAGRGEYDAVIAMYEQAIARDPAFTLAHVHLSIVHGMMYWFGNIDPTPERRALAQASVSAAQRLAPDAPETHYALGAFAYLCENDWSKALEEYRAAEAGLPNDARLHYRIGLSLRRLGRMQESLIRFAHSVSLNPYDLSATDTHIQTLRILHRLSQAQEVTARYQLMFPKSRLQQDSVALIGYALTGDKAAFLRARAALAPALDDPDGLEDRYFLAYRAGDVVAAARVLADPRLTAITNDNGAIKDPVSLLRAGFALLQGDTDAAKRHAAAAVIAYQTGHWNPRQEPLVRLGLARAQALADPSEENVRGIHARLQEVARGDKYLAVSSMTEVAETLAVIGRREEALAILRDMLAGPCDESPPTIRNNPYFAKLKSDPRFEEILQAFKPL